MSRRQIVALAGDSLLTDTVEAGLRGMPDLRIVRLPATAEPAGSRGMVKPDLIIADLHALQLSYVLAYLTKYPDARVLGIDPISNQVVSLSCQHHTVESMADLTRVIREAVPPQAKLQPADLAKVLDIRLPVRDTAPRSP